MTLEDLKNRCNELGLNYAYNGFKKATEPPHLVAIGGNSDNFAADNIVYYKIQQIELVYTYIDKDVEIENKIENSLLADVVWKKNEEVYYSDEDIWQISYFFEI